MTPEEFRQSLAEQGLNLTDEQMQQFELYYEFLVETNKNLNLTALPEKNEEPLPHIIHPLCVLECNSHPRHHRSQNWRLLSQGETTQ